MNKKKRNILLVILIGLVVLLGFFSIIFFKNIKTEKDYVSEFTTMGEDFYSNYYYKIISVDKTEKEVQEYLALFNKIGLKVDLNELEKYKEEYKDTIESFSKKYNDCDKSETMVIIYPKSPYSSTDFDINIKMECNYKK